MMLGHQAYPGYPAYSGYPAAYPGAFPGYGYPPYPYGGAQQAPEPSNGSVQSRTAAVEALKRFANFEQQRAYRASAETMGAAHHAASVQALATAARIRSTQHASQPPEGHEEALEPPPAGEAAAVGGEGADAAEARASEAAAAAAAAALVRSAEPEPSAADEAQREEPVIEDRRYTGKVKTFNAENGFGFIQCAEILKRFGCDAFLTHAVEGGLIIGSTVTFSIAVNKNNKPQARQVVLVDSGKGVAQQVGGPGSLWAQVPPEKVFTGRVKSFNSSRGFGFILCPDVMHSFGGRDVYVSKLHAPEGKLFPGQEVEFRLQVDRHGQPQARNLVVRPAPDLSVAPPAPTAPSDLHLGLKLFG